MKTSIISAGNSAAHLGAGKIAAHPLQWLGQRDRDLAALRRAGRTAIVMPAMFALGEKVIVDPVLALFAAFGSFAMLLLVDFGGSMRERLQAQAALALAGATLVALGTFVSKNVWLAAAAMLIVGFVVIFAGIVSSVLAGASTSLLLAFILSSTLAGPGAALGDRLAGWGMASGAALIAVGLLWPAPERGALRAAASSACRALAVRLRSEVTYLRSDGDESLALEHERAVGQASQALDALHRGFLATPYRPTGLSTPARTIVRLVDELDWLSTIVVHSAGSDADTPSVDHACAVKLAAAMVLERGADLLAVSGGDCAELHRAMAALEERLLELELSATANLPVRRLATGSPGEGIDERVREFLSSLDPSFRAQELGFAASIVARNIDLTAAAERRGWVQRLLGRQPAGLAGTIATAQARAAAHVDRNSVWLHNSVRGAAGLSLAVFVANESGVQHSFWVVLGTLSVLRSSALNTGQNAVRGLLGTVSGFVVGAVMLTAIGTNTTLLWLLLPPAILLAGVAPAAISFAAGQAAFTLTIVFLFNIIQPVGWRVGLLRIEDVALGAAVSVLVGLLFWPRGAGAALRRALADAYTDSAAYLASAVDFGMLCCEFSHTSASAPMADAARASSAARRLDDAFRSYLAERGAKPIPMAEMTSLVTVVGAIRLAADAITALWQREESVPSGDRTAARQELLRSSGRLESWYDEFAESLVDRREPRDPLPHDRVADGRLVDAVRHDLGGEDGRASATAVRMIWTGEHLDAVRRLQKVIVAPAQTAAKLRLS